MDTLEMINYNKIVYVDVDDTIENLLDAWCIYLNNKYHLYVDPNDATEWDMTKLFPQLYRNEIFNALSDPELWKLVHPIPGAQKYLNQLIKDGFDVYLCTATHAEYFQMKYKIVLKKYFPFIDEHHIITIHNKQLLDGLVLVDDYIENLKGGSYKGILFETFYNKEVSLKEYPNIFRVSDWKTCYRYIVEMSNGKR